MALSDANGRCSRKSEPEAAMKFDSSANSLDVEWWDQPVDAKMNRFQPGYTS
jgi:hypothetical protein